MEHDYIIPATVTEALELLSSRLSVFVDLKDALSILEISGNESYNLHWNSPVKGKAVIIPQLGL